MGIRKRKIIAWGAAAASMFFFFNPDFAIVDVLPDFIGYTLLCFSMARIADIDDRIGESFSLMRKMLFLSLAKFAAVIFTMALIPATDRPVTLLTLTFVYSALELFFLLPAVTKLSDGILYLAARNDGSAAYTPARKKSRSLGRRGTEEKQPVTVTEKLRGLTVAFIIVRAVMRTLPEFAVLASQGYDDSIWGQMDNYLYQLRVLASAVVIVFGIIWLVRSLRYIFLLRRDTEWVERLGEKYGELLAHQPDLPARRAIKTAFGFFAGAAILSLDISLDGINFLSDVFSALTLLCGLALIRKYIRNFAAISWITVLYAAVAAAGTYVRTWFNLTYYPEAITRDIETQNAYYLTVGVTTAEALMFVLVFMLLLFSVFKSVISRYTGFAMSSNDTFDPTAKIRELHSALMARLWYPASFVILVACLSVSSQVLIADVKFMWLIEFIFTAIFAVTLTVQMRSINEQIDYKYMLS